MLKISNEFFLEVFRKGCTNNMLEVKEGWFY